MTLSLTCVKTLSRIQGSNSWVNILTHNYESLESKSTHGPLKYIVKIAIKHNNGKKGTDLELFVVVTWFSVSKLVGVSLSDNIKY